MRWEITRGLAGFNVWLRMAADDGRAVRELIAWAPDLLEATTKARDVAADRWIPGADVGIDKAELEYRRRMPLGAASGHPEKTHA